MSSFIVSNKCINRIVTKLYINKDRDYVYHFRELAKILKIDSSALSEQTIGEALFKMNCKAVGARYGKFKDMVSEAYKYEPMFNISLIQTYKDIQSLTYQCSEGKIPETRLYKWLKEFQHSVASNIIYALPEYDQASWGN